MIYNTLHNRWLRMILAVGGTFLGAAAVNIFIVPLGLYTGGLLGFCQILRTLFQKYLSLSFGAYDFAGILYFILNIPLLLFAYKTLGRGLVLRTLICTVTYSLFYSLIPIPAKPVISDTLTSCLLGGILTGVGSGLVLTCGCSSGGLDIVGLCLSKRGSHISVGRFSIGFNAILYLACLFLFNASVAIYSIIYNFFGAMVMDRMHQQNISVQAMIFTREDERALSKFIIDQLGRSVTYWTGVGAYTEENIHVLCVCLSKYEIDELRHAVRSIDPHAFLVVQEGVQVDGNFPRQL
ncbi:MAG: YitT family protein [Oscillibacter sp.]|jgi:uncharacterized membrane-anchored protein YitT (DUF2179 family)|nr:YitT family protein [Oscillibacter sp.]